MSYSHCSVQMSLGFSVGDIPGGATFAYSLCQSLSESKGSTHDYNQVFAELNIIYKVLPQVDQLRVLNQLAQATLNALSFITNSVNEAMETLLTNHEQYRKSLRPGGSGNVLKDTWLKGRWGYQTKTEVVLNIYLFQCHSIKTETMYS